MAWCDSKDYDFNPSSKNYITMSTMYKNYIHYRNEDGTQTLNAIEPTHKRNYSNELMNENLQEK